MLSVKRALDFGGSELQQMTEGKIFGQAPAIDLEVEAARQKALLDSNSSRTCSICNMICQKVVSQLHFVKKHLVQKVLEQT